MKAVILSIGDELILGQTVDTNAAWLSEQLMLQGIRVVEQITVGDDSDALLSALQRAADQADVVVATGGLGPTDDDLTREVLVRLLNSELILHEPSLEHIYAIFQRFGRPMPQRNRIQAMIPAGAEPLANPLGTAAGMAARYQGCNFYFLPGVPQEMRAMFEQQVVPRLSGPHNQKGPRPVIVVRQLRLFGISESAMAEKLGELMQRGCNPLVNCNVTLGVITLKIIATANDQQEAEAMIEPVEADIRQRLGKAVFGTGRQTLAEVVGELLRKQNATLALAESCTGGLIAKQITDVPGSSDYFLAGWVCYANDAKINHLDIGKATLVEHGAVSEPIAAQLAQQARQKTGSTYAIGITGVAGPAGGTPQKPLGTIFIGLADEQGVQVRQLKLTGDRDMIRKRAASGALNLLRLRLLESASG